MSAKVITRDEFAGVLFQPDFFTANPSLQALADQVAACHTAYTESAQKSTCGCGGNPRLIFDCLDTVLAELERLRAEDPAALQTFVNYANEKLGCRPGTTVVLYYRKTSETPMLKVSFP